MFKKVLAPAAMLLLLAACGSGGSSTTGTDSSSAKSTDTSKNTQAAASVKPLPAVPANAKVFFKNLKDGQTVTSPVKIEFGVEGIALEPKGEVKDSSGHHHLLIDSGDSIPAGVIIPDDSLHIHFGKAQTGTELKLAPGKHRLALQYGDGIHRSYGSKLSKAITVTVK
jgi:hypothetical protein